MHRQYPLRLVIPLSLLVIATLSCGGLPLTPTPTPTSGARQVPVVAPQVVGGSGGSGSGGGAGNGGGGGSGGGSVPILSSPAPTPNPSPVPATGPYLVKQTETLGHESISGQVCSTVAPFFVTSVTPEATFTFNFVPAAADHGTLTYAYSIPKAGESHSATGTYTISLARSDGTRTLSLRVSDHVVFKGFDGNLPVGYKFDLVPSPNISC